MQIPQTLSRASIYDLKPCHPCRQRLMHHPILEAATSHKCLDAHDVTVGVKSDPLSRQPCAFGCRLGLSSATCLLIPWDLLSQVSGSDLNEVLNSTMQLGKANGTGVVTLDLCFVRLATVETRLNPPAGLRKVFAASLKDYLFRLPLSIVDGLYDRRNVWLSDRYMCLSASYGKGDVGVPARPFRRRPS